MRTNKDAVEQKKQSQPEVGVKVNAVPTALFVRVPGSPRAAGSDIPMRRQHTPVFEQPTAQPESADADVSRTGLSR